MNILILSRKRTLYSTRRMIEECKKKRHEPTVLDPLKCVIAISENKPQVLLKGKPIVDVDAIIPRVGAYGTTYALCVIKQFDMMGVPLANNSVPIERAKNKLSALQMLAQNGVAVPDTILSRYPHDLDKMMKLVGGTPVILKLLKGTQGTGVIYCESTKSVESVLDTIWSLGEDIILQRYIAESGGADIRILVIGGEAKASMRRTPKHGEFRSNIHKGGAGEKIKIPPSYAEIAERCASIIGLDIAGVDLIESNNGPLVMEVNASPGFEGLEEATKMNIAGMIIDYAAKLAEKGKK